MSLSKREKFDIQQYNKIAIVKRLEYLDERSRGLRRDNAVIYENNICTFPWSMKDIEREAEEKHRATPIKYNRII